jgi:hypothetical protein
MPGRVRYCATYKTVRKATGLPFFFSFLSFRFWYLELPIVQVSPYFCGVPVPRLTEFVTLVLYILFALDDKGVEGTKCRNQELRIGSRWGVQRPMLKRALEHVVQSVLSACFEATRSLLISRAFLAIANGFNSQKGMGIRPLPIGIK